MKNILMLILKGILIFIGLLAASMVVLGTLGLLFKVQFANIWESGFRVAGITMLIVFADWYRGKRKKSE